LDSPIVAISDRPGKQKPRGAGGPLVKLEEQGSTKKRRKLLVKEEWD